jgi:predicted ATPase
MLMCADAPPAQVATSNRVPDKLYEGGLQRALFLPFIALLKQRCEVHDIQGAQDYRRLARKLTQSLYFTGPAASAELQCCFELFAPGLGAAPASVEVMMGRTLHVPRAAGRVAYFTFEQLLTQPVAAADFIALCERYHTVLLDGVPRLSAATRTAAYRLVQLVDVAYEQRARLIVAADASPGSVFESIVTQAEYADAKARLSAAAADELCVDDNVGFSKERTISRLIEMQSIHYAREHAHRRAPELLPSLPPEDGTVV